MKAIYEFTLYINTLMCIVVAWKIVKYLIKYKIHSQCGAELPQFSYHKKFLFMRQFKWVMRRLNDAQWENATMHLSMLILVLNFSLAVRHVCSGLRFLKLTLNLIT